MRRFLVVLVILFAVHAQLRAQTCQLTLQDLQQNRGAPPTEVNASEGPGTCGFLKFSWRAFSAMNWPAIWKFDRSDTTKQTRGLPDASKLIGEGPPDAPTVWDLYQPNWYIFAPNNPPPAGGTPPSTVGGWNQDAALPAACGQLMAANAKKLSDTQKSSLKILSSLSKFDSMPGVSQAFSSAPLIDQRGFYARYEIRANFQTFNYIVGNQFYSAAAQENKTFNFPVQSGNEPGAIFLKAAWKILSDEEEHSGRFHPVRAFLFTPGSTDVQSTCVGPVPVGLVGLHIVQKTAGFPQWIWATFEQIDSAPADSTNPGNPGNNDLWSFFLKGSTKTKAEAPGCPKSAQPCDWQPTSSHLADKTGGPTQAVRENPISKSPNQPSLDQINTSVQGVFRQISQKSVWQFYRLGEAQWQRADTTTGFFPPKGVANMTMETYTQKGSCMACHRGAMAADTTTPADFTFELNLGWRQTILPGPKPSPGSKD